MYFKRFYDDNLAHASYLIGCQAAGEAMVIDPSRQIAPYLETARSQKMKIVAVTETHVHADYLSGTRELAHQTGAKMYLSGEGGPDWQYQFARPNDQIVHDGDVIKLGNLSIEVMHTPGHTPEHISFILTDHPSSDQPMGAFTGDFVFVGDVGRPDLLEKAAGIKDTMEKGAADLYRSLQRFAKYPDHLQIWPAHGAGSACGKALGAVPMSVLGFEKHANWAFQCTSEEEFMQKVLDGQPEPPKYFAQMKKLNKVGPSLMTPDAPPVLDASALEALQPESTLIDLRGPEAFAQSHPRGAIFLPLAGPFVTWAGWLLPYDEPFYLLVNDEQSADRAIRALRSIGLDGTAGVITDATFQAASIPTESSHRMTASAVNTEAHSVVDVRSLKEWNSGHLEQAQHFHLGYLRDRLAELPKDPVLYCGTGVRSLIASSLLQRAGINPRDVIGGYAALKKREKVMVS